MLDDLALAGVGNHAFAHHLAVAKHRVAVGDAVDLIELVADEQDRLALAASGIRSSRNSSSISLWRECRGRLVHDDDLRVDRHGARDRHEMLAGDAEILQPRVCVDLCGRSSPAPRARWRAWCVQSIGAEAGARRVAEEDVLSDGQVVEQHRLLMDRSDALFERRMRAREADRLARRARSCRRRAGRCRSES